MKPNIAIGELVFVCLCTVTVDNGVLIEIDSLDVAHRKVIDINCIIEQSFLFLFTVGEAPDQNQTCTPPKIFSCLQMGHSYDSLPVL